MRGVIFLCLISASTVMPAKEKACPDGLSMELASPQFLSNGSVSSGGVLYPRGFHWREASGATHGCPCNVTRCLRICPRGYYNDTPSEEDFQLEVWQDDHYSLVSPRQYFGAVFEKKLCADGYAAPLEPDINPNDTYRVLTNGSLFLQAHGHVEPQGQFCLYKPSAAGIEAVLCITPPPEKSVVYVLYPIMLLLSVLLLALTLVAYALSQEMRTSLHGRFQFAHALTLLLAFFGLAIVQITGHNTSDTFCKFMAYFTYFFLLSSFFWLNVMCFDIWRALRTMRGHDLAPQNVWFKFLKVSCYATGLPLWFLVTTVAVDHSQGAKPELKPGFGLKSCWFQSKSTNFIYLNGPVSLLLAANFFFFGSTLVRLVQARRESRSILRQGDSGAHGGASDAKLDRQRLTLYLRLFIVMGLSWFTEVLSWAIGGPDKYWFVTDIVNTLQGVLIFVLCVWCTRTRDPLLRALCPARVSGRLAYSKSTKEAASSATKSTSMAGAERVGAGKSDTDRKVELTAVRNKDY